MNGNDWMFYIGIACLFVFMGVLGFLLGASL